MKKRILVAASAILPVIAMATLLLNVKCEGCELESCNSLLTVTFSTKTQAVFPSGEYEVIMYAADDYQPQHSCFYCADITSYTVLDPDLEVQDDYDDWHIARAESDSDYCFWNESHAKSLLFVIDIEELKNGLPEEMRLVIKYREQSLFDDVIQPEYFDCFWPNGEGCGGSQCCKANINIQVDDPKDIPATIPECTLDAGADGG